MSKARVITSLLSLILLFCGCQTTGGEQSKSHDPYPQEPLITGPPSTASLESSDQDGDGVVDAIDACPLEAEDLDGYADEDGCPEADADNDGRPDEEDLCPTLGETINGFEDLDGCPDKGRALCNDCRAIKKLVLVVYFEEGMEQVPREDASAIESVAKQILEEDTALEVFVIGHTSDWGDERAQKEIARQRAIRVREALQHHGIQEEAIHISGRGAREPHVPHDSRGATYLNDRVEIFVE